MKKPLRFVLSAVLTFTLTVCAAAAPAIACSQTLVETGTGFVEIEAEYLAPSDNRAEIEAGAESSRIYSVKLEWTPSGKIVYNAGKTIYNWNNDDLQYDKEVTEKGWTVSDAKVLITAKNRSNRPVEMSCADPVPIDGIKLTGKYDRTAATIPSAAINGFNGVGMEQTAQMVYTVDKVSGDISGDTTNIAGITVTVTGK